MICRQGKRLEPTNGASYSDDDGIEPSQARQQEGGKATPRVMK